MYLLFFRFVCLYSLRTFPSSPFIRFVRCSTCILFSFAIRLFPFRSAQLADCHLPLALDFPPWFVQFPFPSFWLFTLWFYSHAFRCWQSRRRWVSPRRSFCSSALLSVLGAGAGAGARAVREGSSEPSRDAGPRGGSCPRQRAKPGRVPVDVLTALNGGRRLAGIRGARPTASH